MEVCLKRAGRRIHHCAAMVLAASCLAGSASAQSPPADLADMSLENLLATRITSVSREDQDILSTPAAVFVITQQDIRRSGMTDVAELLRTVPGMQVAQVNSSTWAVGARGFNAQYSTKLLVLIDGRSVYDPGNSSVWWHLQNLVLEDIDRIEVIRGPGATMWGANAMNGVISITTKRATHTRGGLISVGGGTGRAGDGSIRFGGGIGNTLTYRAFAKQTSRTALSTSTGAPGGDAWNMTDFGGRVDWDVSARDTLTFQAAGFRGVAGDRVQSITAITPLTFSEGGLSGVFGANVLGRWTRSLAPRSDLALQVFYDAHHHTRNAVKDLEVFDIDLTHSMAAGRRHHFNWGVGYRATRDDFDTTLAFSLDPGRETDNRASAFVQSELTVVPKTFVITIGSKFEHSSFSGGNIQPAVRAVWQPTERQSLWASAARAVRTANRVERGIKLNVGAFPAGNMVALVELVGRPETRSEELSANEVGYRYQPIGGLWFDVTAFRNRYKHLSIVEPGTMFFVPVPQPHLVQPLYFTNVHDRRAAVLRRAGVHASGSQQLVAGDGQSATEDRRPESARTAHGIRGSAIPFESDRPGRARGDLARILSEDTLDAPDVILPPTSLVRRLPAASASSRAAHHRVVEWRRSGRASRAADRTPGG
jgi:iron complex outermembrane recepter protein